MKTSIIHLWDNSWHVPQPDENMRDLFGRKPLPLEMGRIKPSVLNMLSSYTIGELMQSEDNAVLVWPYSFREGNEEIKDQYIFRVSQRDGNKIDSITTNNVVGFIGKEKTDIRIHSRFSSDKPDKKGNVNDFFLYHMLGKVMAINMFDLPTSSGTDMAFDFLLFFFPKLLKEAMSQGMYKKYVYHEYNDANVRGVIDINRHIRKNIPANGRIAYRTREFSYDNPMTQLIRHTIEFIRRKPFGKAVLHNDADTEACVQQIVQATPTFVAQQRLSVINDNLRPIVHPYYTRYAALQKLCLRILRHEKLSYGQANDKIHGLLIDAAWLWEEYVAKVLSEGQTGLKHYTRHNSLYLFEFGNSHFQKVIPDYLDKDNQIVADAKYIPLHRYDHLDADRAAAVYYKTIMYMYRFKATKGFLFHPCSETEVDTLRDGYKVENGIVSCDYKIVDTDGHLYEVGMVIDDKEKDANNDSNDKKEYTIYRNNMLQKEELFRNRIKKIITCTH